MSEHSFGKLGKVEITVLETEAFDVFAKLTSSVPCAFPSGGGPSDTPASPFDDDGPCGGPPMVSS
jgi:hypothetical protein